MKYTIPITDDKTPFTVFFDMDCVLADFYTTMYVMIMQKIYLNMGDSCFDSALRQKVIDEVNRIKSENNGIFTVSDVKDKFDQSFIDQILEVSIDTDDYFYALLPLRDGMVQLAYTKEICDNNPHVSMAILSSSGTIKPQSVTAQKRLWLEHYVEPIVGCDMPYYFTNSSIEKANYVTTCKDTLLDDSPTSINAWINAGGTGVLWLDT